MAEAMWPPKQTPEEIDTQPYLEEPLANVLVHDITDVLFEEMVASEISAYLVAVGLSEMSISSDQ